MTQSLKENGSTAVAEREAELIALQGAFDEYIASSRELEEELDAELAKMRTLLKVVLTEVPVCDSIVYIITSRDETFTELTLVRS
jgi:hypothetical protein